MTKPTSGVAYHPRPGQPEVTKIVFSTTAQPDDQPADVYARRLLTRTVGHLDAVDVGAIITAYLAQNLDVEAIDISVDDPDLYVQASTAVHILRLTALIETVLEEARDIMYHRMAVDLASTLLPRLMGIVPC